MNNNQEENFDKDALEGISEVIGKPEDYLERINQRIDDRVLKSKSGRSRNRLFYIGVFLLLLAIVLYFLSRPSGNENSPEEIYATYYEDFPNVFSNDVRSDISHTEADHVSRVMTPYDNKEYAQFLESLNSQKRLVGNDTISLYKGLAYFNLGQYNDAKKIFQSLQSHDDDGINQAATWYQSLNYIMMGQENEAIGILEVIANDSRHYKAHSARELLDQLR